MKWLTERQARVAVTVAAAAGCGCSSGSPSTPAPTCNTLVNDGPQVTAAAVSTAAPTPAGGAIEDGTYELTAMTYYGDPSAAPPEGTTFSAVFEIAGGVMQQVKKINGSEWRYTANFTISGLSVSMVYSCPNWNSETHSLTATPTDYRTYDTASSATLEQVYTKR